MNNPSLIAVLFMLADFGSRMTLNTEQSDEQILFGKLGDITFYLEEDCDPDVQAKLCISRPSDDLVKMATRAYGRVPNIRYHDDGICFEWVDGLDIDSGYHTDLIEKRMEHLNANGAETIIKLRVNEMDDSEE